MRLPAVRWPSLLLFASIGLTAAGVLEASRAVRTQRAVAQHALQDYAGFAAWSYREHLRVALSRMTLEVLGAVNHGDGMHQAPPVPAARDLARYIPWNAACACHRPHDGPSPATFFAFVLGSDTLGVGVNAHPDPSAGWEVDRPVPTDVHAPRRTTYSAADRRWINDTLTRQIHARRDLGRFPIVIVRRDGVPRVLTYTLMPTTWGDTLVYGAEYRHEAIAGLLSDVLSDRGLLPATFTRGRAMRDVVLVRVTDSRGETLFASEPVRAWSLDDTTSLPAEFGGLHVRAQIRPALANALVIGGLPRSRLPFLLGMLGLSAALAIVAVGQLRREGELARMRGDFVNSISHELRTPLTQMRVYLETLRLGRFSTEEQRRWSIENVDRETTRLAHLVERVLRFSGVGRRGDVLARDPVDAVGEVARIVDEFQPLAAARRARVVLDASPVPSLTLADHALRHVVLNLLDNAVKYGPTGQTVRVVVDTSGSEVRIAVTDEGPGVPAAERERIWRPYARGSTAGHASGSGIGLAIVRDVVGQHGGRAWVGEAPNGVGATFVVSFPAAAPSSQTLPEPGDIVRIDGALDDVLSSMPSRPTSGSAPG